MGLCLPAQHLVQIKQIQPVSRVPLRSAASFRSVGGGNFHPTKKPDKEKQMLPSQGTQRGQEEQEEPRSVGQAGAENPMGMEEYASPGEAVSTQCQAPYRQLKDVPSWWPGRRHLQVMFLTRAGHGVGSKPQRPASPISQSRQGRALRAG